MEMVASWTKSLCVDIAQKHVQNNHENDNSERETDLTDWSVLDVGTGNGLLLQELAKQGYDVMIPFNLVIAYLFFLTHSFCFVSVLMNIKG